MDIEEVEFCPLCSGIAEDTISEVLSFAQKKSYSSDEFVYMEGEDFRGLFVITEGEMRSTSQNEHGKEFLIRRLGPGKVFGESGLIKQQYFESVKTLTPLSCIFLPAKEFKKLAEKNSHLSAALLVQLGEWIADFYDRFQTLSFTNVRDRVEHFLSLELKRMKGNVVVFKLKRHEMASNLGIRPETLSRILKKLESERLIQIKSNNEIDLSNYNYVSSTR